MLILLLSILLPATSNAREAVRWRADADGTAHYWVLHSEDAKTYVDEFRQRAGRLPEKRGSFSFSSDAAADQKLRELSPGGQEGWPATTSALPRPLTEVPGTNVWTAKEAWSWAWEQRYDQWLKESVDQDFLANYGIATDCADVAQALRWIFARINGLPAAANLVAPGQLITHESVKEAWAALPTDPLWHKDQRFLAALNYMLESTFTHTLIRDLYPIQISRDALIGGTIFLHLYNEQTGHTEFIYQISTTANDPEPIRMIASDVPRAVRKLHEYGMQDWGSPPDAGKAGLFRFRWPVQRDGAWTLLAADEMPFYSLEQYEQTFTPRHGNFTDAVIRRLYPGWHPDYAAFMKAKLNQLKDRLQSRLPVVTDGFAYCSGHGGCPEGSAGWEAWSTPSRDAAIGRLVEAVDQLSRAWSCNSHCRAELSSRREEVVGTVEGRALTLGAAFDIWRDRRFGSDPNTPVGVRWGL